MLVSRLSLSTCDRSDRGIGAWKGRCNLNFTHHMSHHVLMSYIDCILAIFWISSACVTGVFVARDSFPCRTASVPLLQDVPITWGVSWNQVPPRRAATVLATIVCMGMAWRTKWSYKRQHVISAIQVVKCFTLVTLGTKGPKKAIMLNQPSRVHLILPVGWFLQRCPGSGEHSVKLAE